jgi:5-methylcytosine-specific restriction protein A
VKCLKPRLAVMTAARLAPLVAVNPDATPRPSGRAWMTERASWLTRYPLCEVCAAAGRLSEAREVDHIEPLCEGGADDASNYQALCLECHREKTRGEATRRADGRRSRLMW